MGYYLDSELVSKLLTTSDTLLKALRARYSQLSLSDTHQHLWFLLGILTLMALILNYHPRSKYRLNDLSLQLQCTMSMELKTSQEG